MKLTVLEFVTAMVGASALAGLGGYFVGLTGFPHRHQYKPTGHWVPVGGGERWFATQCACGAKRITTSAYRFLPWDDADEIRMRLGEWKFDIRVRDAEHVAEALTKWHS